jgi:hypothetical protein
MKHLLPALITIMLMIPLANAVTIDGPTNFIGPHGGTTRFNIVAATQINVINNIWRFTGFSIGGVARGNMGFDCNTGTNMTITGVSANQVTYTVASPAASTQYIYYANRQPNRGTGATTLIYDDSTGIATVTAPNGATVILDYSAAVPIINQTSNYLPLLAISLIVMAGGLVLAGMRGELTPQSIIVVVIASVALIITSVVLFSFIQAVYSAGL